MASPFESRSAEVGHDLESPNGAASDWDCLFLARGVDEVVPYRPFFTGDVFEGVTVTTTKPRSTDDLGGVSVA